MSIKLTLYYEEKVQGKYYLVGSGMFFEGPIRIGFLCGRIRFFLEEWIRANSPAGSATLDPGHYNN